MYHQGGIITIANKAREEVDAAMGQIVESDFLLKMRIIDAVEELLANMSYDDLRVTDICKKAGVSRATFYRHFEDRYDIVQWHFNFISEGRVLEIGRTLTWYEGSMRNSLEHEKRKVLYQSAWQSRGYQSLVAHAKRVQKQALVETITTYKGKTIDDELMFQIDFSVGGEATAVSRWARDGMPYSSAQLAEYICSCIPRRLIETVERGL